MKTIELHIDDKKATGLINFLEQLDFVHINKPGKKNSKAKYSELIIPGKRPGAKIEHLFGSWKKMPVSATELRNSSRRKTTLEW